MMTKLRIFKALLAAICLCMLTVTNIARAEAPTAECTVQTVHHWFPSPYYTYRLLIQGIPVGGTYWDPIHLQVDLEELASQQICSVNWKVVNAILNATY